MSKQETVQEAAEKLFPQGVYVINGIDIYEGARQTFVKGAKWQSERMYSEEDMITFGEFMQQRHTGVKESFEQFKKKV